MSSEQKDDGAKASCVRSFRYLEVTEKPPATFVTRTAEVFTELPPSNEAPLSAQQTFTIPPVEVQTLTEDVLSLWINLARMSEHYSCLSHSKPVFATYDSSVQPSTGTAKKKFLFPTELIMKQYRFISSSKKRSFGNQKYYVVPIKHFSDCRIAFDKV